MKFSVLLDSHVSNESWFSFQEMSLDDRRSLCAAARVLNCNRQLGGEPEDW